MTSDSYGYLVSFFCVQTDLGISHHRVRRVKPYDFVGYVGWAVFSLFFLLIGSWIVSTFVASNLSAPMEREQDGKEFNQIHTRMRMRTENRLEGNAEDIRAQAAARPWVL